MPAGNDQEDGRGMRDVTITIPPPCDVTLGMTCIDKSRPGLTVWQMMAAESFANTVGVVQGGFLTAMADSAMGSAVITSARAAGRKGYSSSIEIKTSYLAPARVGSMLECTARVVQGGRRVLFAEAEIVDDQGTCITRSSGSYLFTSTEP
jgi:uncharacterized protein (TIGR00369 family)